MSPIAAGPVQPLSPSWLLVLPSLPLPPTPSSSSPSSLLAPISSALALQTCSVTLCLRPLDSAQVSSSHRSTIPFHLDSLQRLHPGFSLHRFCDGLSSWLGFGSVPSSSLHQFRCESSSVSLSRLLCGSSVDSYSHSSMESSSCISYN